MKSTYRFAIALLIAMTVAALPAVFKMQPKTHAEKVAQKHMETLVSPTISSVVNYKQNADLQRKMEFSMRQHERLEKSFLGKMMAKSVVEANHYADPEGPVCDSYTCEDDVHADMVAWAAYQNALSNDWRFSNCNVFCSIYYEDPWERSGNPGLVPQYMGVHYHSWEGMWYAIAQCECYFG